MGFSGGKFCAPRTRALSRGRRGGALAEGSPSGDATSDAIGTLEGCLLPPFL